MKKYRDIIPKEVEKLLRELVDLLLYDKRITNRNFSMERLGNGTREFPSCPIGWTTICLREKYQNQTTVYTNEFFNWAYSCNWSKLDDTKEGAAGRILYALDVAVPDSNLTYEILKGSTPYPPRLRKWLNKVRKEKRDGK